MLFLLKKITGLSHIWDEQPIAEFKESHCFCHLMEENENFHFFRNVKEVNVE